MNTQETILVIGAAGQIGSDLVLALRKKYGNHNVIATDVKTPVFDVYESGPFEILDVLDKEKVFKMVKTYKVKQVYLLAALLSATAEQNPKFAWNLNMNGLFNVLSLASEGIIEKIFWPSSIAVFGPTSPQINCPQYCTKEPTTVYGISKLSGELWCDYFHKKYGVDVRSIRYPGLISYKSEPGGGTTDYAVHIFHRALMKKNYTCYLKPDTRLPMMYMDDAIRATIELMEADKENIKVRSSYNISGIDFTPDELYKAITTHFADFKIDYAPDKRQAYADSWPKSIDDSIAKEHWNWAHKFDLTTMTAEMIKRLKQP